MIHAAASLLAILLAASAGSALQDGDKEKERKPTGKGDPLTVKGCLNGGALEATDISAPDASTLLLGGLTFRLTGDKRVLKDLRARHNHDVVEVRGVLKSDLPQPGGQGPSVGGVRIAIGAPSMTPGTPQAQRSRSLPVLEVKTFRGGETACGR